MPNSLPLMLKIFFFLEQNAENINAGKSDQTPSQQMPPQKQAALVDEALDKAVDALINEISIKVMLEADDGTTMKEYSPLMEEELSAYNNNNNICNNSSPGSTCAASSLSGLGGSTSPFAS